MAKWFRSEPMEYISIIMNEDAAHDCLADLGKLGAIQFTDVRRKYVAKKLAFKCPEWEPETN
jgi:vacuolar-type H+-ATPase subunit I/STV1